MENGVNNKKLVSKQIRVSKKTETSIVKSESQNLNFSFLTLKTTIFQQVATFMAKTLSACGTVLFGVVFGAYNATTLNFKFIWMDELSKAIHIRDQELYVSVSLGSCYTTTKQCRRQHGEHTWSHGCLRTKQANKCQGRIGKKPSFTKIDQN